MPNHFLTVGLCARDWSRDPNEVDFESLEGANLCQILEPLPDALLYIVASEPPCRYVHKESGEVYKDRNRPLENHNEWDRVELDDSEIAGLKATYGAATWYDWQRDNWGTKWGTYSLKVHEMGGDGSPVLIEFQTAWGPPRPEMMQRIDRYLSEAYSLQSIHWIGHDPASRQTVNIAVGDEAAAA